MAGLVSYASSDEEDDVPQKHVSDSRSSDRIEAGLASSNVTKTGQEGLPEQGHVEAPFPEKMDTDTTPVADSLPERSGPIGPSLPKDANGFQPLPEDEGDEDDAGDSQAPSSPYTANRLLVQDLTLPSVPDFDIPPSPPGSPPAAVDKKFTQFLELKKKGIHFNTKLQQSAALKNPSLMDKLMQFVELEGSSQYETTLSKDLWDPDKFPEWAYRSQLRASRERIVKEREASVAKGTRTSVDFVPGSTSATKKR